MELDMKVVGIIQARMGSNRLPGKVMMPLGPKTAIDHVVSRLKQAKNVDLVVVATSDSNEDDILVSWCSDNNIEVFRGSETDVLDRYHAAAISYKADVIVRITADCPLIDPDIVDEVIDGFFKGGFDGFGLTGGFPDGLDCQVFSFAAIDKAWKEATLLSDREHVGSYIENTNPSAFNTGTVELINRLGFHRWTLDEKEDYIFLNKLLTGVTAANANFRTQDVLDYLLKNPSLMGINSHIKRNESYWKMRNNEKKILS
jgi:spore coat polysaccharide biosynthesis protein SpsF